MKQDKTLIQTITGNANEMHRLENYYYFEVKETQHLKQTSYIRNIIIFQYNLEF